jgi:hypothetical protein
VLYLEVVDVVPGVMLLEGEAMSVVDGVVIAAGAGAGAGADIGAGAGVAADDDASSVFGLQAPSAKEPATMAARAVTRVRDLAVMSKNSLDMTG